MAESERPFFEDFQQPVYAADYPVQMQAVHWQKHTRVDRHLSQFVSDSLTDSTDVFYKRIHGEIVKTDKLPGVFAKVFTIAATEAEGHEQE